MEESSLISFRDRGAIELKHRAESWLAYQKCMASSIGSEKFLRGLLSANPVNWTLEVNISV
jgi:hypothetical protein